MVPNDRKKKKEKKEEEEEMRSGTESRVAGSTIAALSQR